MSWLSNFWSHNRNFLGNALKNVSPAAFLIPGVGPLAAAGLAGAGSALGRGIQKGANVGDILRQGVQGAGEAYLGGRLTGGQGHSLAKLKSLFTGGGGGSPAAQSARELARMPGVQFTPSSNVVQGPGTAALNLGTVGGLGGGGAGVSAAANAAAGTPAAASRLSQALKFTKDNPLAVGMGLQGAGQLASLPAENRLKRAQQAAMEFDTERQREELDRQRARDEALAPLWKLFEAQLRERFGGTPGAYA